MLLSCGPSGRCQRLGSAFDGDSQLGSYCLDQAKIIGCERVLSCTIQGQHGEDSRTSLDGYGESRSERTVLRGIIQTTRFDGRIAVRNRFVVLRHPS